MKKAILTTKVGMTQIFNEDGVLTPVTVLQAGPCVVTQVKTEENDGYSAVQVGFVDKKEKGINKPQKGHFDKAGVAPKRFVREFRFENAEEYTVGQEIKADIFAAGDKIDATATSKGKGYAGGIKRHGLKSGPSAHGSKYHRHAGSNGMASDPSKVFKGKKMPGQMGAERNEHLVHLAVVSQLANNRQGTQKAKTRSEVRGGGRKPWRQKGTGHARQGSIRAPQWKGGGVVFAPTPREYTKKLNKKERRIALKSALTSRVQADKFVVIDEFKFDEIKTKNVKAMLDSVGAKKALVVMGSKNDNLVLSARNLPGVKTALTSTINVYDILKYDTVVVSKEAVANIEEVYA